jgi:hypothetical protein
MPHLRAKEKGTHAKRKQRALPDKAQSGWLSF